MIRHRRGKTTILDNALNDETERRAAEGVWSVALRSTFRAL